MNIVVSRGCRSHCEARNTDNDRSNVLVHEPSRLACSPGIGFSSLRGSRYHRNHVLHARIIVAKSKFELIPRFTRESIRTGHKE